MPDQTVRIQSYHSIEGAAFLAAARESTNEVYPWLPWCHPEYSREEADAWVAEKSGALREGVIHDRLYVHGRHHDAVMYAALRSAWRPA